MGFQDRRYDTGDYGEGGGVRRALRRMFVEGDDFFGWSLPLFSVPRGVPGIGGIAVRIHLLYVLFIVVQLLVSLRRDGLGVHYTAAMMATLFVLVLLHEFGHCLACRRVGGEADRVLMWPLGGLAFCRPPHRWDASLITTLGGPGVNVVLVPVLGGALLAAGAGWDALIFNPFDPQSVLLSGWFTEYWRIWLWSAYFTNLVLLGFNMLLPMFPMDAGRVVQEVLWARIGYRKSMTIAVNLGLVLAIAVGLFALMGGTNMLFAVAVFAGITCFAEKRRLAMMEDAGPLEGYDFSRGYGGMPNVAGGGGREGAGEGGGWRASSAQDRAFAAAAKRQEADRLIQVEVDRILEKIAREGMGSLTRKERATLKDATERKRGSSPVDPRGR